MAMSLQRTYPDLPCDMVNIVASYMPEKAKSWLAISKGKVIRIKVTNPDLPDEPSQTPKRMTKYKKSSNAPLSTEEW